ncbi:MAG: T9SS type A sorting domain-containing protein [Lentimicrobium sp.]|jgi:hypothetical protein
MKTPSFFLILAVISILFTTTGFTQSNAVIIDQTFPDCFTRTYTLRDLYNTKVFDQNISNHNIYAGTPHGGQNQQWIIMPTYPGSYDAFIVSKENGYLMDRNQGSNANNNLYCFAGYAHGGNNQKFRMESAGSNSFKVYSTGTAKVIDRSLHNNDNIYCNNWNGGNNQKITFNTAGSLGNTLSNQVFNNNIYATPPPLLNSLYDQFASGAKFGEVLVSQTLVPFTLVKNDPVYGTIQTQVLFTPYYRLQHKQYYKLISQKQFAAGDQTTYQQKTTSGLTSQNSTIIKDILNFSYDYNMKITVKPIDLAGIENSNNLKFNMGREVTVTNSVTQSYNTEFLYSLVRTTTQEQLYFFYILVDEFNLYRMNENSPFLTWTEMKEDVQPLYRSYPNMTPGNFKYQGLYNSGNLFAELPPNSIPVMTSNTSPSGVASASSNVANDYSAWKAFDGEDASGFNSRWISSPTQPLPQWLGYNFGQTGHVQSYCIEPEISTSSPRSWHLQGFNGSTWVTIDTRTNYTLNYWQTNPVTHFTIPYTASYSSFRLYIYATNGSSTVAIKKFKLYATNIVPPVMPMLKKSEILENSGNLNDFTFNLYPNPTTGNISFEFVYSGKSDNNILKDNFDHRIVIEIFDTYGNIVRRIEQKSYNSSYDLDLKPGTYFVRASINNSTINRKLIII